MRFLIFTFCIALFCTNLQAQFSPTEKGLTIIVTDGTDMGKNSDIQPPTGELLFKDPVRPLGMTDAIQAGAFLERPQFGISGFILVFCVNDSIGGETGSLIVNGEVFNGVYRLIRQKFSLEEEVPEGMGYYKLSGTVYFLGIS